MLHRTRDDEFKLANSQPVRNIQNASHVFVFFQIYNLSILSYDIVNINIDRVYHIYCIYI